MEIYLKEEVKVISSPCNKGKSWWMKIWFTKNSQEFTIFDGFQLNSNWKRQLWFRNLPENPLFAIYLLILQSKNENHLAKSKKLKDWYNSWSHLTTLIWPKFLKNSDVVCKVLMKNGDGVFYFSDRKFQTALEFWRNYSRILKIFHDILVGNVDGSN